MKKSEKSSDENNNQQSFDTNDEAVIEFLYEKLGRAALSKTIKIVQKKSLAEEIVQDVFESLLVKKPYFESIRSAYAWIYRCCTNKAIDHFRSSKEKYEAFEKGDEEDYKSASNTVADPLNLERQYQSSEILGQLSKVLEENEISIIIYRDFEGLKQEEMAEVMGVSRSTINRLIAKTDKKMAEFKRRLQ